MGGGQGLGALPQGRPGNGQGVDRVRLAGGAFATTALAHQLRGDAHHPLARGEEEALQGAGDVAAILDCPDALRVEVAAPVEQLAKARLSGRGGQLAGELPVPANTAPQVWVRLWVSLPSDGPPADEPHLGRCHAPIKSSRGSSGAAGDTTDGGQTLGSTASLGVSSPPSREPTGRGRTPAADLGPTMTVRQPSRLLGCGPVNGPRIDVPERTPTRRLNLMATFRLQTSRSIENLAG